MQVAIAAALVESRLAACVNLFPVQSVYTWQGQLQQDDEWQLVIKTDLTHFAALKPASTICTPTIYRR